MPSSPPATSVPPKLPQTPSKAPKPPVDSNPDCYAVRNNIPRHLFNNCTFICEQDEEFTLGNRETCFAQDPIEEMPVKNGVRTVTGDEGVCIDGKCVIQGSGTPPKHPKPPKGSRKPKPPPDTNPDCYNLNTTDYVYQKCSFICQVDELFTLRRHERCILPGQTPTRGTSLVTGSVTAFVTGICVGGKCVLNDTLAPPQKPTIPTPPTETNPDCAASKKKNSTYLYHNCTFACEGDEEVALVNKESCVLKQLSPGGAKNQVKIGGEIAVEMGFCVEGQCVPPGSQGPPIKASITNFKEVEWCVGVNFGVTYIVDGKPPRDTNPDCAAWKKKKADYPYNNCTFICEGDEDVLLNSRQFCVLKPQAPTKTQVNGGDQDTADLGVCVGGRCISNNIQTPETTRKPGPPRDTNPDCNAWRKNLTNYLYRNCMFVCEGDEEVPLSNKQSCVLHSTSEQDTKNQVNGGELGTVEMGYCKDGKCVPLDNKAPITNCYAWEKNQTNYLYHNCTFVCQLDEEVPLNNGQSCILKPASASSSKYASEGGELGTADIGHCVDGKCVRPNSKAPIITNCTAWRTNRTDNLYHTCTFTCEGDERVALQNKESCVRQPSPGSPSKHPGRENDLGTVDMGQCVDGKCVPLNSNARTSKQPRPPKETNPDCTAWMTNRTDNIFHTCMFTCEADERVALRNNESCVLPPAFGSTKNQVEEISPSVKIGVCDNGKCVPRDSKIPPQKPIPGPPIDINPDCSHVDDDIGDYVYQNCTFVCEEDQESYLNSGEKCVLQGQHQVAIPTSLQTKSTAFATGVCKEGQCVSENAVIPPNQGGPKPPRRSRDCEAWKNRRMNYGYRKCSFSCEGDEMVYLKRGEKCVLPKWHTINSSKKGRRTRRKGICENGVCVLRNKNVPPHKASE
ncbi:hypothetical protein MRX96_054230 [Rhipicephalus microplus]